MIHSVYQGPEWSEEKGGYMPEDKQASSGGSPRRGFKVRIGDIIVLDEEVLARWPMWHEEAPFNEMSLGVEYVIIHDVYHHCPVDDSSYRDLTLKVVEPDRAIIAVAPDLTNLGYDNLNRDFGPVGDLRVRFNEPYYEHDDSTPFKIVGRMKIQFVRE